MISWEPWHRIEYRRETGKGKRELKYTENIEDTGWRSRSKGYTKEEWFAAYTRWCAEDFLGRCRGEPGEYVVTVYCTGDSASGEARLLGAIRMNWPPGRGGPRSSGAGIDPVPSSRG